MEAEEVVEIDGGIVALIGRSSGAVSCSPRACTIAAKKSCWA
jgi:hypothetical protein